MCWKIMMTFRTFTAIWKKPDYFFNPQCNIQTVHFSENSGIRGHSVRNVLFPVLIFFCDICAAYDMMLNE